MLRSVASVLSLKHTATSICLVISFLVIFLFLRFFLWFGGRPSIYSSFISYFDGTLPLVLSMFPMGLLFSAIVRGEGQHNILLWWIIYTSIVITILSTASAGYGWQDFMIMWFSIAFGIFVGLAVFLRDVLNIAVHPNRLFGLLIIPLIAWIITGFEILRYQAITPQNCKILFESRGDSECYVKLAQQTKNPTLCLESRRLFSNCLWELLRSNIAIDCSQFSEQLLFINGYWRQVSYYSQCEDIKKPSSGE